MWTDFFRSRYIRSLEQQLAELKAEKAELKAEIAKLQKVIFPGLRQVDREEKAAAAGPVIAKRLRESVDTDDPKKGKVERMPPVKSWIQARDQAEMLSQRQ